VTGDVSVQIGGDAVGGHSRSLSTSVEFRTSPRWNLSIGPRIGSVKQDAQYVATVADPSADATYGARYVFAPLDQAELSLVTRFNYTFTPDLTLQVYAQPLVANGGYGVPKYQVAPARYDFAPFNGAAPDRSFTTRSLRGNAVLRWEYRPGSTCYLVWQQERLNDELLTDFQTGDAISTLLDAPARNVLVAKWSYWINP
jgi:hypothetical protein